MLSDLGDATIHTNSRSFEDFVYWTMQDCKNLKKILQILKDIEHNGYGGIGKPERLTGESSSYWNRRIDDRNRIVCQVDGNIVRIVQCGSLYRDAQNGNSLIRDSIHGDLARPQRHLRTAPHRSSRYRGARGTSAIRVNRSRRFLTVHGT